VKEAKDRILRTGFTDKEEKRIMKRSFQIGRGKKSTED